MELFRLTRLKYSKTLSGKGAAIKGARWNSAGVEMIYAASNRSLAMAEVMVHFTLATLPMDYMMLTIFVPDKISYKTITAKNLKPDWNSFPHVSSTKVIGDKFIDNGKYCMLRVPSAITPGDYSFLINPSHPDFGKIKIVESVPFPFNDRIFK